MGVAESARQERIDLRTSADMKALISRAAAYEGLSVSAFLVNAGTERAREVLSEQETLTLSPGDWEAFFKALDNAGKRRPKLQAAVGRYRARRKA